MEPAFLSMELVDDLHAESLKDYGGTAGVRDREGIESALGAAQNAWFYGQGDFFDIAAAYAFHIAQAQGYLDGNKRTAIATAIAFLAGNGFAQIPTSEFLIELQDAMIAIANRTLDKAGLAEVFRRTFESH